MEVFASWLITVFSVLWLFGNFTLTARKTGIWFNPSSLLALAWVVYIGIPLLVGIGVEFNAAAALYIALYVSLFSLSLFLFDWKLALERYDGKAVFGKQFSSKVFRVIFGAFVAISVVFHMLDLGAQGISIGADILAIAGEYAQRRYSGELNENIFAKLALMASFQCAVLGGLAFGGCAQRSGKVITMLAAFVPSTLVMLLQSAKGLLFLSAAYFIGGWLVTRLLANDLRRPQIPLVSASVVSLSLFSLVLVSFVARVGFDLEILRYYLASYSSGHFFAFSDWFSDRYLGYSIFRGYDQPELQGGFYTFMGIFRALGDSRDVPLGVYDEFFDIPGLLTTNIFTAFRGLISDFGLMGSMCFAVASGFVANSLFFMLVHRRTSTIGIVFFVYIVGVIYQSYVVSSLTWISIPISASITAVVLFFCRLYFECLSRWSHD